jgi:hypothetical protein
MIETSNQIAFNQMPEWIFAGDGGNTELLVSQPISQGENLSAVNIFWLLDDSEGQEEVLPVRVLPFALSATHAPSIA